MSTSLRDQLVKAGLASSSQAKKAEKQKLAEERAQRHSGGKQGGKISGKKGGKKNANQDEAQTPKKLSTAEKSRQLRAKKAAKDKATAKVRNDKYAERAMRAELKQLILKNDKRQKVADEDAVAYNFVHGKKIKRIYVSAAERDLLSAGQLMVVNNDGIYHFVLPDVAKKIGERDPKRIIVAHQDSEPANKEQSEDDAYYAKFEVPDDLDW